MLLQIHTNQKLIETFSGGHGQKWVFQFSDRTLDLTASQGWTDGINRFLHAATNPGKLNVDSMILGGRGQKWPCPFSSLDPKTCCILRTNL